MGASDEQPPLEWDPPLKVTAANTSTRGVRDRYIAARFPGQFRRSTDLADTAGVVDAARRYFDEGKVDRALELLDLAVAQSPETELLQLARLEVAFLVRDTVRFCSHAREFHEGYPGSKTWIEVARLGRAIAPADALFGARQGPRAYEHYGPWPHTPNWINASWDLGSEVLAADFHGAMEADAAAASPLEKDAA